MMPRACGGKRGGGGSPGARESVRGRFKMLRRNQEQVRARAKNARPGGLQGEDMNRKKLSALV